MKQQMYSIYDNVAEIFNKPFTDHNDQSAMRSFQASFMKADVEHKEDYVLYRVAEWNDASGEVTPCLPSKIMSGFDIKTEAA